MTGGPMCKPKQIKPSHTEISDLGGTHWVRQASRKMICPVDNLTFCLCILQKLGGADIPVCLKAVLLICHVQRHKASSKQARGTRLIPGQTCSSQAQGVPTAGAPRSGTLPVHPWISPRQSQQAGGAAGQQARWYISCTFTRSREESNLQLLWSREQTGVNPVCPHSSHGSLSAPTQASYLLFRTLQITGSPHKQNETGSSKFRG